MWKNVINKVANLYGRKTTHYIGVLGIIIGRKIYEKITKERDYRETGVFNTIRA